MFVQKPTVELKQYGYSSEPYLIITTALYTVSLTVSSTLKRSCEPVIPFGECLVGVYENQHYAHSLINFSQYLISFVVVLLAGAWSDSHGRRRKPLIFLPIIAQILTDGLYIVFYYWHWPSAFDVIMKCLKWLIPAFYVGRNMFWVGVMSYVSENSTIESRTLKHGIIIATYPLSLLVGAGIVALIKIVIPYYSQDHVLFLVTILFNLIALVVVNFYIKDTSDSYDKDIKWQKPKYILKEFISLFKNKSMSLAVILTILIICQSILVTRIGCDYDLLIRYIENNLRNDEEVYFSISRTLAIFFGIMFSVSVLSRCMKINDLKIGILSCCFYIAAAICYIFPVLVWQIIMITIIYLCNGTVVTIISSLVSKLVATEQLGCINSIQMCMNSLLTVVEVKAYKLAFGYIYFTESGHLCLMAFLYIFLTLPILSMFMILHSKYKHFWKNDTIAVNQKNIYTIS